MSCLFCSGGRGNTVCSGGSWARRCIKGNGVFGTRGCKERVIRVGAQAMLCLGGRGVLGTRGCK